MSNDAFLELFPLILHDVSLFLYFPCPVPSFLMPPCLLSLLLSMQIFRFSAFVNYMQSCVIYLQFLHNVVYRQESSPNFLLSDKWLLFMLSHGLFLWYVRVIVLFVNQCSICSLLVAIFARSKLLYPNA